MAQTLRGTGLDRSEIRKLALECFQRHWDRPVLIGEVCLWIGRTFGLRDTEEILDEMVLQGILRLATREELRRHGVRHGYFLAASTMKR